jgi:hypothetical protein
MISLLLEHCMIYMNIPSFGYWKIARVGYVSETGASLDDLHILSQVVKWVVLFSLLAYELSVRFEERK